MSPAVDAVTKTGSSDALAAQTTSAAQPIVVLSYAFGGAESLTAALSAAPSLACTSGTGLIPLCNAALHSWQQIEGRTGPPSRLALSSVRSLASAMLTAISAGAGARRWCETAFAQPTAAAAFHRVFPSATFVCTHRDLRGALNDGLRAYPWGLGGSPFSPYSARHPGNSLATIATYWAASAESLLEFEAELPSACVRFRVEELASSLDDAVRTLSRLGLGKHDLEAIRAAAESARTPEATRAPTQQPQVTDAILADRIPPELINRISGIQAKLGYKSLS